MNVALLIPDGVIEHKVPELELHALVPSPSKQDDQGYILRDTAQLQQDQAIDVRLATGAARIKIAKVSQR